MGPFVQVPHRSSSVVKTSLSNAKRDASEALQLSGDCTEEIQGLARWRDIVIDRRTWFNKVCVGIEGLDEENDQGELKLRQWMMRCLQKRISYKLF